MAKSAGPGPISRTGLGTGPTAAVVRFPLAIENGLHYRFGSHPPGCAMYVCICNGYREADVLQAAAQGARFAEEAYLSLGSGPCCGKCLEVAQSLIDSSSDAPTPARAQAA